MNNDNDNFKQRAAESTPNPAVVPVTAQPGMDPLVNDPCMVCLHRNGTEISARVAADAADATKVAAILVLEQAEFRIGDQLVCQRL